MQKRNSISQYNNRITFITFTHNSESKIKGLLENIKDIVDEIVVVDDGSEDRTINDAKSYNAKVFLKKCWGTAEPNRMFALKQATNEWVLYLDPDERLNKSLKNEFRNLVEEAQKRGFSGYSIWRLDLTQKGEPIPGSETMQIRVFKKSRALYKGIIHELPKINGQVLELPKEFLILHLTNNAFKKYMKYAYLVNLEHYYSRTRSNIMRSLRKLAPISVVAIYLLFLYYKNLSKKEKLLSLKALSETWSLALYESVVFTLRKFRNNKEKKMAKLIQEKGFIQLLHLDE